jgi:acetylglutamate kinase
MNTVERKLKFVQEFLRITDEETIGKLEQLLRSERIRKISNDLKPLTIEELNEKIDLSEMDFKDGRFVENSELLKTIDKWK